MFFKYSKIIFLILILIFGIFYSYEIFFTRMPATVIFNASQWMLHEQIFTEAVRPSSVKKETTDEFKNQRPNKFIRYECISGPCGGWGKK